MMNQNVSMNILYEDIIMKVLKNLPIYYESLVDSFKVQMDTEVGVKLCNLKLKLRSKYQCLNKQDTLKDTRMFLEV